MSCKGRLRGFVLPTTLLVMTLLTVMLTAAFILVSAEARTTDNSFASQRALAVAQAGLQNYFSQVNNLSGASTIYDSTYGTNITFANGYAAIGASRIVDTTQGPLAIWLVRSYGYVTDPRLSGQTQGKRVVAQLARYSPGRLYNSAALIAANPTQIVCNTPLLCLFGMTDNPLDGDLAPGCAGRDTFSLTTAAGDYFNGPFSGPSGPIKYLASRAAVIDSTHIDWPSLLAGNFTPDHVVTGSVWAGFPGGYPVFYGVGNLTVPTGTRSGIVVATGDLTLSPGTVWNGVVIVGGRLIMSSTAVVYGSVITGLNNTVVPGSVGANQLYRPTDSGTVYGIRWSPCAVASATAYLGSLAPLANGWIDTWSTY